MITLNKSVISNNTATGAEQSGGGGISNGGTLVSNNSQIIDNSAVGEIGAGLLNHATATLNKTVVSGNTTDGLGGGIVNAIFFAGQPTPTLLVNNSQVTGNSASRRRRDRQHQLRPDRLGRNGHAPPHRRQLEHSRQLCARRLDRRLHRLGRHSACVGAARPPPHTDQRGAHLLPDRPRANARELEKGRGPAAPHLRERARSHRASLARPSLTRIRPVGRKAE